MLIQDTYHLKILTFTVDNNAATHHLFPDISLHTALDWPNKKRRRSN
jgi:hypothetical protein